MVVVRYEDYHDNEWNIEVIFELGVNWGQFVERWLLIVCGMMVWNYTKRWFNVSVIVIFVIHYYSAISILNEVSMSDTKEGQFFKVSWDNNLVKRWYKYWFVISGRGDRCGGVFDEREQRLICDIIGSVDVTFDWMLWRITELNTIWGRLIWRVAAYDKIVVFKLWCFNRAVLSLWSSGKIVLVVISSVSLRAWFLCAFFTTTNYFLNCSVKNVGY